MELSSAFQTLGISLGLGLLVGTQRERVDAPLAGVRTFALITLLGTIMGLLALQLGPWVVIAGFAGVALASATGNLLYLRQPRPDTGITTEIAILVMYAIGAYLVFGPIPIAVVLGGLTAVLLHAKPYVRGIVKRLGETDMRVMMQFVLITLVILPVLPDRPYGPFQVLNPREIWWMVVLVVAINLAGYVALKLYGARAGVVLGALIGGLISSTATTVSYARRASAVRGHVAAATLAILVASTVVYARVMVEIGVVAPRAFATMAPPIAILLAASVLLCIAAWRSVRARDMELPEHENPTELKPALVFGGLYALVLVIVAAARERFGESGLYAAAGVSGLTDMDAITLSTSRMAAASALSPAMAWRAIVIAAVANLVFKASLTLTLGGPALARRISAWFGIEIVVAIALLVAWPR